MSKEKLTAMTKTGNKKTSCSINSGNLPVILSSLFWGAAIILLFFTLGHRSLWGSEGRWAEIAREMMISGDYFHPTINGIPYFDKPLFTYWVITFTAWITGTLNEFTVRFPGALAGILTLWCTISLGKTLLSRRAGYLAAFMLLTSYGVLFWSRTACADIENVAFILLAVVWYWHRRDRPGFTSYMVFYLICAAGAHFKGLPAAILPGAICFPDIIRNGRWKQYISFSHAAAIILGVLLYLTPFLYAAYTADNYNESGLYLAFRENILRFFNAFDHQEPFYVYLYYVPFLFLPWSPALIFSIGDAVKRYRQADNSFKWLVEATLIIFLIYTISDSRRSYYILPIVPFCALLTAKYLSSPDRNRFIGLTTKIQYYLLLAISIIEICAPLTRPLIIKLTGITPPDGLMLSLFITGILSLAVLTVTQKLKLLESFLLTESEKRLASIICATFILCCGFFCWQQNVLEKYRFQKEFITGVKQIVKETHPENVALANNDGAIIFYLDFKKPIKILSTENEIKEFLSLKETRYLIIRRRMLSKTFSILPEHMKKNPDMASDLYPGQKRTKKQLLMWKITGAVEYSIQ